jgi:hypothetical protein
MSLRPALHAFSFAAARRRRFREIDPLTSFGFFCWYASIAAA